jgi:hypothetical protein
MLADDRLDRAVRLLAVSEMPLLERLQRCRRLLAALEAEDFETEQQRALYARVQLGLSRLGGGSEQLPVFALEAIAAHIVDLRDATAERSTRAAHRPRHGRRPQP